MSAIRERFEEEGYLINTERRLPEGVVRRAADGMMALRRGEYDTGRGPERSPWKPGDPEHLLCKIEQPQMASRAIFELISHPILGELAGAATGAKWVQVWWVQLLFKPPARPGKQQGTNVGWHQDRSYWGAWEADSELFTAWVAVSDVTADAGPMRFVPGSHRWGLSAASDFYGQDLDALKAKIAIPPGEQWTEVPAILPPGGFSFHDDLLWHGSGPNVSAGARMAFAVHLRTDKSRPVQDRRDGLTTYIDDPAVSPIIYRA
jgi:hypothetical protein